VAAIDTPRVSIGVPVFNGADLLPATLESLLSQSFGDFELIISDNASGDATWDVCNEFAKRDNRVRIHRQPRNLGAPANWNFVARQARGRFFKWAAASDLCHPDLLARCLDPMERDATVALCFARTAFIDGKGGVLGDPAPDFAVLDERPADRFRRVCHELQLNNAQSGLIRSGALRRTGYDRHYPHGDRVLMAELALQGKFVLLEQVLLFRRAAGEHFTGARSAGATARMFRPDSQRPFLLLNARRHGDFLASALRAPVSLRDRSGAAMAALRAAYWDRRGFLEDARGVLKAIRGGAAQQD
jgi:glycosyltransferase involved in cell wall biosynthesis